MADRREIRFSVFLLWFDIISPNCRSRMPALHFVVLSPDPRPTSKQKKGRKDKKSDWNITAICTRSISAISSFPPLRAEENWKIDVTADESGGKTAIASFPPLAEEENWNVDFTADGSGGKAATASFPPLGAEGSWRMQLYRRWGRR